MKKTCSRCKKEKTKGEFYKSSARGDGLDPWCKECRGKYSKSAAAKKAKRKYHKSEKYKLVVERHKSTEKYRETKKAWAKNRFGVDSVKEAMRLAAKEYRSTKRGRETKKITDGRYRDNNPNKVRAWEAVTNAVNSGVIPPAKKLPCQDCGKQAREYHHESYEYDRRLDVIPLCNRCHNKRHGKF